MGRHWTDCAMTISGGVGETMFSGISSSAARGAWTISSSSDQSQYASGERKPRSEIGLLLPPPPSWRPVRLHCDASALDTAVPPKALCELQIHTVSLQLSCQCSVYIRHALFWHPHSLPWLWCYTWRTREAPSEPLTGACRVSATDGAFSFSTCVTPHTGKPALR